MCKACSPGGIPLSESLSSTPAGVCSRETVPTSWRFVSLSSALADWAAAGRTSAVANKPVTLMVRVHFRNFMPWSPRRQSVDSNYFLHGLPHLACRALLLSGDSARGLVQGPFGAQVPPIDPQGRNRRALCLSQIKSGRICDAVRRGPGGKEYALPSQQYAIGANPYPRTGACASHYSSSYTIGAHGEDAARRTQQRGQGTPVGSSRSVVQQIRFAMGTWRRRPIANTH